MIYLVYCFHLSLNRGYSARFLVNHVDTYQCSKPRFIPVNPQVYYGTYLLLSANNFLNSLQTIQITFLKNTFKHFKCNVMCNLNS